jgi:ribosomal subunit interface protein
MQIKLSTVNFDADKKLVDFVENKVNKLEKFFEGIISSEVILTLDRSKSKGTDNKEAKIILDVPGAELFADKIAKTFEESVDLAIEAIEKQIKKFKEKKKE